MAITLDGTNGITTPDLNATGEINADIISNESGTGAPNFPNGLSVNSNPLPTAGSLSNRNLIINGAMQVAQRGTSFSYNSFGGANFCVDRFWFYNGGDATSGTIEQSTDVPSGEGFAYSLFNNTDAAMPSGTNVELTKQGNAAPFVVGNTYTLSFWVKGSSASSGITLQIAWRNSHANGTNSTPAVAAYPTFNVTTSWERVVIPFTLNTSPVSQNNVLDFEYNHPAGAKITGVQLEAGDTATPFEHRSYGQELALCQRYYEFGTVAQGGAQITSTLIGFGLAYAVSKRATPTVTFTNTLTLQGITAGLTGFVAQSNVTNSYCQISRSGTVGTGFFVTGDSGFNAWTASAEL